MHNLQQLLFFFKHLCVFYLNKSKINHKETQLLKELLQSNIINQNNKIFDFSIVEYKLLTTILIVLKMIMKLTLGLIQLMNLHLK